MQKPPEDKIRSSGGLSSSYNSTDWETDWLWISSLEKEAPEGPTSAKQTRLVAYFDEKYRALADSHRDRMLYARKYAFEKRAALSEGKLGIGAKDILATGRPLIIALWRIYANCPDDQLATDFPVEAVLDVARETERGLNR